MDQSALSCRCRGCSLSVSPGVEDKVERDAAPALLKQQATAAPATDNSSRDAAEHVIVYPSRLIYYLNKDSESAHHDLHTRVKNQPVDGQVSWVQGGMHEGDGHWDSGRRHLIEMSAWSIVGLLDCCTPTVPSKLWSLKSIFWL